MVPDAVVQRALQERILAFFAAHLAAPVQPAPGPS
jgi:hypothetical protein